MDVPRTRKGIRTSLGYKSVARGPMWAPLPIATVVAGHGHASGPIVSIAPHTAARW